MLAFFALLHLLLIYFLLPSSSFSLCLVFFAFASVCFHCAYLLLVCILVLCSLSAHSALPLFRSLRICFLLLLPVLFFVIAFVSVLASHPRIRSSAPFASYLTTCFSNLALSAFLTCFTCFICFLSFPKSFFVHQTLYVPPPFYFFTLHCTYFSTFVNSLIWTEYMYLPSNQYKRSDTKN